MAIRGKHKRGRIAWTALILLSALVVCGVSQAQPEPSAPVGQGQAGSQSTQLSSLGASNQGATPASSVPLSTDNNGVVTGAVPFRPVGSQLLASFLPAGSYSFHPRISAREVYSDNINLAPSNRAQSDFITELVPGFDLTGNGRRVRGSLSYSLQGVAYAKRSSSDHIFNQVSGNINSELIPRHFFLSANSSYSQAIINPSAPSSASNLFVTGNRTNAWVSRLQPYWLQDLGTLGTARLSYAFGNIQYGSGGPSSSHSNTYEGSLRSHKGQGRLSWSTSYRDYEDWLTDGWRTHQRKASGSVSYEIWQNLALVVNGGWERNQQKYISSQVFQGTFWAAGFKWSNPLNRLEITYGHRFFGPTYHVSIQHVAALVTTDLAYTETVNVVNEALQNQALQALTPQSLPSVPLGNLNSFELYVSKRFSGSIRYHDPRTSVALTGYDERRTYLAQIGEDHVVGASLGASWKAGARTVISPRFSWSDNHYREGGYYTLLSPAISFGYKLGLHSRIKLGYRYEHRNGHAFDNSYTMNMVYLQFNDAF